MIIDNQKSFNNSECDKPLVSVVCMTYNHEKYISTAIKSFLNQETSFPFEIIIHDDASTDNTTSIIKKFEKKYPDIIKPIYQEENQYSKGVYIFMDEILPHIRGKYVAVCEGDDYWNDKLKLQKQFDYMESHDGCSLVSHLTETIRYDLNKKDLFNPDFLKSGGVLDNRDILIEANLIHYSSQFYRKTFLTNNYDMFKKTGCYDMDFVLLAATEGYIYVIPQIMSVYRYWTKSSWSVRMTYSEEDFLIEFLKKQIKTCVLLDKYRNFEYRVYFKERVRRIKFHLLQLHGDLKTMKSPEYKDLYDKMPFYEKIITIYKGFPKPIKKFIYCRIRPIFLRLYLEIVHFTSKSKGFSNYNR